VNPEVLLGAVIGASACLFAATVIFDAYEKAIEQRRLPKSWFRSFGKAPSGSASGSACSGSLSPRRIDSRNEPPTFPDFDWMAVCKLIGALKCRVVGRALNDSYPRVVIVANGTDPIRGHRASLPRRRTLYYQLGVHVSTLTIIRHPTLTVCWPPSL
jgi:hypothetical protein